MEIESVGLKIYWFFSSMVERSAGFAGHCKYLTLNFHITKQGIKIFYSNKLWALSMLKNTVTHKILPMFSTFEMNKFIVLWPFGWSAWCSPKKDSSPSWLLSQLEHGWNENVYGKQCALKANQCIGKVLWRVFRKDRRANLFSTLCIHPELSTLLQYA